MDWLKSKNIIILILLLSLVVFILSIYDIFYDKGWMVFLIVFYVFLLIISFVWYFLLYNKKPKENLSITDFEKTLSGGLYHFKCPICNGTFAVKKSRSNNKKPVEMTCPDCGANGVIPSNPGYIEEEIPNKKSVRASFKCSNCGEGLSIWAEGIKLQNSVKIYTCPFCGSKEELKRI